MSTLEIEGKVKANAALAGPGMHNHTFDGLAHKQDHGLTWLAMPIHTIP